MYLKINIKFLLCGHFIFILKGLITKYFILGSNIQELAEAKPNQTNQGQTQTKELDIICLQYYMFISQQDHSSSRVTQKSFSDDLNSVKSCGIENYIGLFFINRYYFEDITQKTIANIING